MAGVSLESRFKKPIVSVNRSKRNYCILISKLVVDMLRITDGDVMLIDCFDGEWFIALKPITAEKKIGALMRPISKCNSMKGQIHVSMGDIGSGIYEIDSEPMYKGGIDWFEITKIGERDDE